MSASKGFTQVDNALVDDTELSLQAKGLYTEIKSKPDDWKFYRTNMISWSTNGRDATMKALKELKAKKYVTVKQVNENGKFSHLDITVNGFPVTGNQLPETSNRKSTTTNTNRVINNSNTKELTNTTEYKYIEESKQSFLAATKKEFSDSIFAYFNEIGKSVEQIKQVAKYVSSWGNPEWLTEDSLRRNFDKYLESSNQQFASKKPSKKGPIVPNFKFDDF